MTLKMTIEPPQSLEEAQDTNRRMNRRLGATEAELHRLCSKALDQVDDANELLKAANQTITWRDQNITFLRGDIDRLQDEADGGLWGGLALFIWAMTASVIAYMLWIQLP